MELKKGRRNGVANGSTATLVSERLARRLGDRKYDLWFGPSTRLRVEGRRLEVMTESKSVADWIGSHFAADLRDVAMSTLGESAEVEVRVDEACVAPPAPSRPAVPARNPVAASSRRPDLHLPLRHRFEDFVVGASNRLAYSSARHLAEGAQEDGLGPLFLHGECGLGKTHLLQAICRRRLERFPSAGVRYTTGEQFTNEYIAAVKQNALEAFRKKVRGLDLLAIDDIHFLSNKTATQAEFMHTLDAIAMGGARLVMASDEHPRLLTSVSRALVSRFMAGLVVEIERPDREMRLLLVRRLAESRGVRVNDAAVEMIAAHCVASVREIEGALAKLAALVATASPGGPPTDEVGCVLVERLFKSHGETGKPLRIAAIIDAVCARLSVDRSELMGTTRHRRVVTARGVVSYLARELTTMSYPEIGRALGRKNHSTVLTAGRRAGDQIEAGERVSMEDGGEAISLRELVDQLRHDIRRGPRQ